MKKKDVLLQQIVENNSASIVSFAIEYATDLPIKLGSKYPIMPLDVKTAIGFFVAPDTIVTTIENIAGAVRIIALPTACLMTAASNGDRWLKNNRYDHLNEEHCYTIEGIRAFDTRNNLVLMKIAETGVPLVLNNSETVSVGEKVYILNFQDDVKYEAVAGTLQCKYRNDTWFQLGIPYTPGNGGGPALNSKNEVIGVVLHGLGSILGDSNHPMIATVVSSNVLKKLLALPGKVMSIEELQQHSRVHAYVLEETADKQTEFGDNKKAIKSYNTALKLNPDLVGIYSKRGIVKSHIGNINGAFKDFDRMLQINPAHIFSYNNRASAKSSYGDTQGALDDLNKAIAISPAYTMAYINLGEVKFQLGEMKVDEGDIVEAKRYTQEAIDHFTQALVLDPKSRDTRKRRREAKRILRLLKLISYIK